ncbi:MULTISPECIES: 6-phospho-3-hexuloisomerase [Micrococcaceae]|uniref:6-phospho-3-hexuloisomerase n=1 Tax=Micrococcaceae TaxID=1268 RepID=UPI00027DF8DE|nr:MULTISPECIES: 6-phospho-3-hexuloisomerase [Micrococcaceae]AFR27398.1 3-hexulose-6-phosphate isomerase RmpB [Arthrobacter sp. Rue61a]MBP2267726.1 6-phospho-3-hexuloisomerase [Pseudarthrobacter sp. PvP004]
MNVTAESITFTSDDVASNVSLILGEVADTASGIDYSQVSRLADKINGAERVFLTGAGRSGLALRMAAMRLMHLGKTVHVAGDTTTPAISAGDLLVVASGSGTTSGVVKAAQTALAAGAQLAAITTNSTSPLAGLADAVVVIPAAQKTDHVSNISRQYSGSLFEQSLFLVTEAVFHTLWGATDEPAEQLWLRHANLE